MNLKISCIYAFIVTALFCGAAWSQDNSRTYTVKELTAAVSDHEKSIESLFCEYVIRYGDTNTARCRYARAGVKWHYSELSPDEDRKSVIENTYCCDGDRVHAFIIRRHVDGTETWTTVEIQDPRAQGNLCPDFLFGSKLSNVERPLADVLKLVAVTKSEAKLPDKTPGFRLTAKGVSSTIAKALTYDVEVLLDPVHDLLPREILITQSADRITWPGWKNHWTITEYRRALDERTKRDRWFPVAGRLEQLKDMATIELAVETVRINAALDARLFLPDIPANARIRDQRKGKSAP